MRHHAPIYRRYAMTKVFYFSGSGHSLAVAKAVSEKIGGQPVEIDHAPPRYSDIAVVVFPVYCQNIPKPVKMFLNKLAAKHIALIATYGRISHGNVLREAQKLVQGQVIAGAYIATGHTFLGGDCVFDAAWLEPLAQSLREPKQATIPEAPKDRWADLFPGLRSRLGTGLWRTELCDRCGLCEKRCPVNAIRAGRITSQCIRCLRCVTNCPKGAMRYKNRWLLERYLRGHWNDHTVLYL